MPTSLPPAGPTIQARSAGTAWRASPGLVEAVAALVAIAAERARAAGELAALREAIEHALEVAVPAADDPLRPG